MSPRINASRRAPISLEANDPPPAPTAPPPSEAKVARSPSDGVAKKRQRLEHWLQGLRETQGGVAAQFPSTHTRKIVHRAMADSCSGVSRHLAARAIGLFHPKARYRDEAKRFRSEIRAVKHLYPTLSQRLSKGALAAHLARSPWYAAHGRILVHLQSTQSMTDPKAIRRYNARVLPRQLKRIGGPTAKAAHDVSFHLFHDTSYHRRALQRALATGAPVVISIDTQDKATSTDKLPNLQWNRNCHYVVAIKIPGRRRIMVIDPWPDAAHGGVSYQRLDHLHMPGTYNDSEVRLGTIFGVFRDSKTKQPIPVTPAS